MNDTTCDICDGEKVTDNNEDRTERAAIGWSARARDAEERADVPRPLTPDAITDEMVRRAIRAFSSNPFEYATEEDMRAILIAALTEPPARPEGAEGIEALIRDLLGSHPGEWCGDLADHLATHLTDPTRKEA